MAVLTLLGLYQFRNDLFDDLVLPDDVEPDLLIENLIIETADMEVIYPDPDIMKAMINRWSLIQMNVWKRLADAFNLDYNPIWNVDGSEKEVETHDLHAAGTVNRSGTELGKVTGYNSDTLRNNDQTDSSGTSESTGSDTGTITRVKTRGGNIGVTMTQQMLESELETRPKLNIYRYIIEDFKQRFCLLIY